MKVEVPIITMVKIDRLLNKYKGHLQIDLEVHDQAKARLLAAVGRLHPGLEFSTCKTRMWKKLSRAEVQAKA